MFPLGPVIVMAGIIVAIAVANLLPALLASMAARIVCRADVGFDDAYRASLWVTATAFLVVWLTLDIAGHHHIIPAAIAANIFAIPVGAFVYGRNLVIHDEFPIEQPHGAIISLIIAGVITTGYFVLLYR
jgi:hypothetical protein